MTLTKMHLDKMNVPDSAPLPPRQGPGPNFQAQAPWWDKERHAAKRARLLARNAALAAVRRFFDERGFIEIETPILQRSPGNETHLHAFSTVAYAVDGTEAERLYLHTSPEFSCKKLLAAGEQKIFTLARTFRNRENGPLHAREFVMLEWYRAGATLEALMEDCTALVGAVAKAVAATEMVYSGMRADPFQPARSLTVSQAFAAYAGIDLKDVLDDEGQWKRDALAAQAQRNKIRIADDDTAGDIFSRIMVEKIEPQLKKNKMVFLTYYPLAEAALAKPCEDDPRFAQRFEFYACGVELANGFGELTDADEQRVRFEAAMNEKERIYGERYPIDEDFLNALVKMPSASGIALGFERLLMLLMGANKIQDVMWAE